MSSPNTSNQPNPMDINFKEKIQSLRNHLNKESLIELKERLFQDKRDRLINELTTMEAERPDDARVKNKLAELLFSKGDTEQACEKFLEVAARFEKDDFTLKAIKTYSRILAIKPFESQYNVKLAKLYLKLGMTAEASNQYRIAINHHASNKDLEMAMGLSQDLVKIDPSVENRAKLAEIYQSFGMTNQAIEQYEIIAKYYRKEKNFDRLLHFYELLLPHQEDNKATLRDVCILTLRKQNPKRALKLIEQYNVGDDPVFKDIAEKAHMMIDAIKRQSKAS